MAELHRRLQKLIRQDDLLAGRYRIGRRVGAGAYGMIFRATDERDGSCVAVKAIPPEAQQRSETAMGRFHREMKVIRSLNHPNIISLHDWGRTEEGLTYMVLEFIDGQTLDEVVRNEPMDQMTALETTLQLARALEIAHEQGVIHRDLKPANVMLIDAEDNYRVKVLDFGMAKVLAPIEDESIVDLTREGMAVGTPRYIAPEQARGLDIGPTADLYALGLLMYEMFTGVQAVQADTVEAAVAAHVSKKPLELSEIELVPVEVRPVLFRLLEKDADRRIATARELIDEVEALAPGRSLLPDHSQVQVGPPLGDVTGDFPGAGGLDNPEGLGELSSEANFDYDPEGDEELELDYDVVHQSGDERSLEEDGSEELELDYEHYEKFSPREETDPVARRKRISRDRWFRPPRGLSEWAESGVTAVLIAVAFVIVGAQVGSSWAVGPRMAISSMAPVIGLGWAMTRDTGEWGKSFGRRGWICCAIAIVMAHALGPSELATELTRNPAWFLRPFDGLPGAVMAEEVVTWFSRNWAALLFELTGTGAGMAR